MKKDDRIDGILERLGLASRNYCYQQEQLLPDLTYEKADIQMQQLRKESLEWLKTNADFCVAASRYYDFCSCGQKNAG